MIDLDNLERLERKATPGPWRHGRWQRVTEPSGLRYTEILPSDDSDMSITQDGPPPTTPLDLPAPVIGGCGCCGSPFGEHKDAALICEARNALPALLAVARAAVAYIDAPTVRANEDDDGPIPAAAAFAALVEAVRALKEAP